ncbi:hypothetical protein E3N88_40495 [Mikania micrantha]|uniref:Uncharacterized protein n=1 Tax=Mikania micrantha TaxID=192012 RepID=A0A5N6LQ60_9ASTR|nr:hypothetical protein E3N88_40495 [Mikania micrantha]
MGCCGDMGTRPPDMVVVADGHGMVVVGRMWWLGDLKTLAFEEEGYDLTILPLMCALASNLSGCHWRAMSSAFDRISSAMCTDRGGRRSSRLEGGGTMEHSSGGWGTDGVVGLRMEMFGIQRVIDKMVVL